MFRGIIILCLLMFIFSCAKNITIDDDSSLGFGADETLDIITWNIENFPKQDNITINYLVELIDSLDVDIIALQEIKSEPDFNNLVDKLDGWEGYRANSAYYNIDLAYLYKSNLIIKNINEIEELNDYNLARIPLLLEVYFGGQSVYIINNHYKCCGNGTIENIYSDEEYRRQQACFLTKNYIDSNLDDQNVILLGDFNDELMDPDSLNVFDIFIKDDENYQFVDMGIAFGSSTNWSYPGFPSHLDHILITNELFDEFDNTLSTVQIIHVEDYFEGGWNEYVNFISDHRPVGLKLNFNQ